MRKFSTMFVLASLFLCTLHSTGFAQALSPPVAAVMDDIVPALCAQLDADTLQNLTNAKIMELLSEEQRETLATAYWSFSVSKPVVVSIARDTAQSVIPFWLEFSGFEKTDLVVKHELSTYEVWQKRFDAGHVGLGINGFDRHRPHYFVGVGPAHPGDVVEISNTIPIRQTIHPFSVSSFIYHDWPDLILTEVPEALEGHLLLPTIRGRAREAQLIDAFRATDHPATNVPDMAVSTWSDDPRTTRTIQWRATVDATDADVLHYRLKDTDPEAPWQTVNARRRVLSDRNIINQPSVQWFTATLAGLEPNHTYEYALGGRPDAPSTPAATFQTAPEEDIPFTFLWMSDTHNNETSIELLETAWNLHPDTAFLTISGDLVGTGQQRDDWDRLFTHYAAFLQEYPIVPSIGNHDAIDGLGSELYRTLLTLPNNGPEDFERGQSYALRYANLLLISLDVTAPITEQTDWLDATLGGSEATWKVAVLHFPPYAPSHDYEEIRNEWGAVFDRHHLDLALSGHVHYYLRSHPMRNGTIQASPADGTIYLVSVAVPGRDARREIPDYAAFADYSGTPTCVAFSIDGGRLIMRSYAADGTITDSLVLEK